VDHLGDLDRGRRQAFLFDSRSSAKRVCRPNGLRRINYEVLGLHGHVHARYDWEPADTIGGRVWHYPEEIRDVPEHAYSDEKHGALRAAITQELNEPIGRAYRPRRLAG
jgi:hypothetical protein